MVEVQNIKNSPLAENPVIAQMAIQNHEQVLFCNDNDTGLKAIIAVHNTVLGPSLGGTRMWAYKNELEALSIKHHFIISQVIEDEKMSYEKGRIDKEKITRLVPDYLERDIYVCGPTPMMKAVVSHVKELGVPNNQIHFEKFSY